MSSHLTDLPLLIVCFVLAIAMTFEGIVILRSKKKIIPLSSKFMYWITMRFANQAETTQKFAKQNTPENIHSYAIMSLIPGGSLAIACIFYLNWMLSH